MLGRLLQRLVLPVLVAAIAGTGMRAAGPPPASAAVAGQWSSGGPYADDATAVAASPAFDADGTVFMGVSYETKAGQPDVQGVAAILRSTDRGLTWTTAYSRSSTPGTTREWLTQIVVSPAFGTDRTVFATWSEGLNGAVLRSTDGGASFQQVGTAGLETANKTLSISPTYGADHTIAVTASAGTSAVSYVSTDGGSTWRQVNVAVADPCAGTLAGGGFLLALGGSRFGSYVPSSSAVCSNNLDQLIAVSAD